jgi:hypothetical protein
VTLMRALVTRAKLFRMGPAQGAKDGRVLCSAWVFPAGEPVIIPMWSLVRDLTDGEFLVEVDEEPTHRIRLGVGRKGGVEIERLGDHDVRIQWAHPFP